MNWSIKLFTIWGIEVKFHLTFLLILAWAAYRWSGSTGAGLQGALFGVVATLLLFAAVTLHELGHSFQALKYGVKVRSINLMPLGGLAQMDEIPEKPAQELRIAIAGPLVNFALAGLLILAGALLQVRSVISLNELAQSFGQVNWTGMLAYLTMANLALGVFNLIPAFPMDGGRILRALLAMKMDYTRATSLAVNIGQGLAWVFGLWGFFSGSYTLVLIAIFVWMGAGQEGKQTSIKSVLGEMKVGQAMTRKPATLSSYDPLNKAVELTLSTPQKEFPVVEPGDGALVGLLTEADLMKGLQSAGHHSFVGKFMSTRFPTATPEEPLFEAHRRMADLRVRAMPVVDQDGRLAGFLTASDADEAYRLRSAGVELAPAAR